MNRYAQSSNAFDKASKILPGGVNSPVRAFKSVGGDPITVVKGKGAWITDVDGNNYCDFVLSWGPLILGHAPDNVVARLAEVAADGTSFGMPTLLETELAELVQSIVPSMQKMRFVSSGTEACMSALRLARAVTQREKTIKCEGCYHGHTDSMLVSAGSGLATLGTPSSPGVAREVAAGTVLVQYNDLEAVEQAFRAHPGEIAAMIVEPVPGNMGCIPPQPNYLQGLRRLCDEHGAVLIFDEVMCGFRVALGGAQARYGVIPDLTVLGKVVGGGLPCAAYGGRAELMSQVAPEGPVYQAGTLSGNPLAMAAGLETLTALSAPGVFATLEDWASHFATGLRQVAAEKGEEVTVTQVGTMLTVFFTAEAGQPVCNFADAAATDVARFGRFFRAMLDRDVFLPPSAYEAWFTSTCHGAREREHVLHAFGESLVASRQ